MTDHPLLTALTAALAEPLTGEALFDECPDMVFFVKNADGAYVVVNETLVRRLQARTKRALLGRRPDEVFPAPLGESYRVQDQRVVSTGVPVLNRLELHLYPTGMTGWCLTHKVPLRGKNGAVAGLIGLSRDLQAPSERGADYARLAEPIRLIQTRYAEPLTVGDLAKRAGLSPYQFDQRIRRIFQITPGQFLQKTRLDAAARLLRETQHPIGEVALACGYTDQSAFTRQFRQVVGLTPGEYRRIQGI